MSPTTNHLILTAGAGIAIGAMLHQVYERYLKDRQKLKLYVYDHCPYCVRVRLMLGLKGVTYDLIFLESADFDTPIGLCGAKQAPILQFGNRPGIVESMELVRLVDAQMNGPAILAESFERPDLQKWFQDHASLFKQLYYPRYHQSNLAEFARQDSRNYFQSKKEQQVGVFSEMWAQSPDLIPKVEKALVELEKLFYSEYTVSRQLSYDDIDVFGQLRGLTLVKGLNIPSKIRKYLNHMSEKGDVLLFDNQAI